MAICIWQIQYLPIGNITIIAIQIISGALIYILGSRICKFDVYFELINMIKRKR